MLDLGPTFLGEIKQGRDELRRRLAAIDRSFLAAYPTARYIYELDAVEQFHGYNYLPPVIQERCSKITRAFGTHVLDLYHRIVLLDLMERHAERRPQHRIPDSVQLLLVTEFQRISAALLVEKPGFYLFENELFTKDLGICRLKLLPCGSEMIDVSSGVPRSLLFRGGLAQFVLSCAFFTSRLGGFRPVYESHWDRRLVRHFTSDQYDLCYLRVAELLSQNPKVKGMTGASWWFDPCIEEIAPELLFLRQVPEENGARFFRVGTDANAVRDAITFSNKRRVLYEHGQFLPTRYMLVWPRDEMLAWAHRFSEASPPGLSGP